MCQVTESQKSKIRIFFKDLNHYLGLTKLVLNPKGYAYREKISSKFQNNAYGIPSPRESLWEYLMPCNIEVVFADPSSFHFNET